MKTLIAAAAAGTLVIAGAPAAFAAEQPSPNRTYIVDCQGELQYKPKEVVFACGDAGVYFGKITWKKWDMNAAVGRGTLYYNTCEPTCSAGNVLTYPKATITLGDVATGPASGTFVSTFTTLTGAFGPDGGPAMAAKATWALDNPIAD